MKNEEKHIESCLRAILNNIYPEKKYEIICIDNGSSDRTVELARKYTASVYSIPDKTISYLRNYGAQKAQGEYLAFVDADCIVDRLWMEAASVYFKNENIVCFGSTPGIPIDATWVQKTWYLNKAVRKEIQKIEWLESMNLFIRKDVFFEVGGFNEELLTCEDVDLCYRIGEEYQIISDKRIKVIHLGEARTLTEFFKKELWRGKSNLNGLKEHGLKIKEIPSIVLPLYYLILPIIFLILLYLKGQLFAVFSLVILLIAPPLLISINIATKTSRYNYILKASTIYLIYFTARAISLIR